MASCLGCPRGVVEHVAREVHVDQQRQQWSRRGTRRIDLVEGPLEDVSGEGGLSLGEVDRGDRTGRFGVVGGVDPVEQLLGVLEPALADAQVGQPDERAAAQHRSATEGPQPDGFGQRRVGFRPAAGGGQDAAVMRAAEGRDGRKPTPFGDRLTDPDPLVGAGDVVGVLAGREELAEDLLEDQEIVDLAARHGGERLVEERHALLRTVGVDEACPEVGERHELQVGVGEAARQLECLPEAALPCDHGRLRTSRC